VNVTIITSTPSWSAMVIVAHYILMLWNQAITPFHAHKKVKECFQEILIMIIATQEWYWLS